MTSKQGSRIWVGGGMQGTVCALLIFAFLLATNRYYSLETDPKFITNTAGDVWRYAAIADAAPARPTELLPHHHAQRFALPALAGLVGDWIGISNEWVMRVLVILILLSGILLTERFAQRLGFETNLRTILTALIFLNPYSARIGLSMPFMGNDLGFVLGMILILSGLYMGSVGRMVAGALIAILCRQTAVLFIFPMGLYFMASKTPRFFSRERMAAAACAILVLAGYFFTGKVAAAMSEESKNLDTLTGLFIWLANDFDFRLMVLEFGGRPLAAWAVPVAALFLLPPYLRRSKPAEGNGGISPEGHDTLCAAIFLLTAGLIALQPVLGGPGFGNLPRLTVLGLWALVFGVALLIRDGSTGAAKIRIPHWAILLLLTTLALHSMHHLFTWPGRFLLNEDPSRFFVLQIISCALLLAGLAIRPRRLETNLS